MKHYRFDTSKGSFLECPTDMSPLPGCLGAREYLLARWLDYARLYMSDYECIMLMLSREPLSRGHPIIFSKQ